MPTIDQTADDARTRLISALRSTANGDAAALRCVYDLTSAKLFGICLRISGDREAAEDILQNVYVKVWRRAAGFDAERASPITWLAIIARNACIDWQRTERRHEAEPDEAIAVIADDAALADETIERDERSTQLSACLDGLDDRQRHAIRDAFFGGLTYQELSDKASTPLGTMKSWIRRGLLKLKECLGDG